jgi:hypothetical protein
MPSRREPTGTTPAESTGTGTSTGTAGTAAEPTGTAGTAAALERAGTALSVPVALVPAVAEAIGRYRTGQDVPTTGTGTASAGPAGTAPVEQTGTGPVSPSTGTDPADPADPATHITGADMTIYGLPDGLPADWILEDITTVTAAATAASDAGDLTGLRRAFADLATLTGEAIDLLRAEELDAIARHNIPVDEATTDLIAPNRQDLEALQEVARAGDYDQTMKAFATVVERIGGMDAAGLLICQLITAGSAALIEIVDAAEAERQAAATVVVPVG